ncbi:LLM class F420-dependent oxidoreductase [Methylobacterium gregans]|uniref:F420-dependent glucose-6-phosphate dehydrogenase n=2 Tax=Methylobacterium gregans TaxID=374424 RepID=A0AA37HNZ6_9HYPH|nr:TIGR03885 family FMN-dependent LLM class oxidoreductase [Methylobacterium gregans]MDQ0518892.1 putative non-F420 flavinoid oxidoreductase [Methylobacterium gregans]GJD79090.1 F420-dependent glucose-6-phosphate dehydrogenase [Methylobacterium gregans]GLS56514.1 LLM class F420-dependent oxidoreductase [Methylobacterium gregans]
MARIGYHVSHEQHAPSSLLRYVGVAEAAGFVCAMSSEHFKPWSNAQGHSGNAWSWLGAALARTQLPFGIITAPGYRHHPAVLAQSAATLSEMFPRRLWLALGSGQRLNEDVTGLPWPEKAERTARLAECAQVIRALFEGETVTHRGRVTVVEAKLYSRPAHRPMLIGAAVTPDTARRVAEWADGLVTVGIEPDKLRPVFEAFWEGGGQGKPVFLQTKVCWDPDPARALAEAHTQWASNMLEGDVNWELRSPENFETAARFVRSEDVPGYVRVSSDLGRHAAWLAELAGLGPAEIIVHQVAGDQSRFAEAFGRHVLPQLG